MSSVNHAIALNNEGVLLLLASGEDRKAVDTLTRSLSLMKCLLDEEASRDSSSHGNREGSDCDDLPHHRSQDSECPPMVQPSGRIKLHDTCHPLPNLTDSSYFIYNHLITLLPAEDPDLAVCESGDSQLTVYSACIIMNLALAYHRNGRVGNGSCLRKAESLYGLVDHLLSGWACHANATAQMVRVAALNNLTLLFHECNNWNLAQQGLESFSFLMRTYSERQTYEDVFEPRIWSALVLNILFLNSPHLAAAA